MSGQSETKPKSKTIVRIAYEAYADYIRQETFINSMPPWTQLDYVTQEAWEKVILAILDEVKNRILAETEED